LTRTDKAQAAGTRSDASSDAATASARPWRTRPIPEELRKRYIAEGWWTRESLGDLIAAGLASAPEQTFRVHSAARPFAGPFRQVEALARRLAGGLRELGVGAGDVVAFQLPNWMEAAAAFWASALLGAVVVPIVHFYGPKELGYILEVTRPRVFLTAERFGRMVFQPEVVADVPVVGVVDIDFDELLSGTPMVGVADVDPEGPALIAFTSGTTRHPKGVIHSHQTLICETRQLMANYPAEPARLLTALPVGHFIGMLGAFLVPVLQGAPIDLLDVWDPERVLALMDSHGVTIGGGPPYFVTSLLDHPRFRPDHLRLFSHIGLGGSAVPAAVTQRLTDLGITVTRSYGSTEHPSITGSSRTAAADKRLFTDGCARPGVEIRLTDDGEILSRGPDLCLGYTDQELTPAAFDAEGWYRTGDVGVLDPDGYLAITDRKSDIIIRGGENISALEVEDVLLTLPAVAEAAVVAAPDPRLGERAAAVLRLREGHPMPSLEEIRDYFAGVGLARQKWPEQVIEVADFPRTASGKIQKYRVRQQVADHNR
jgi:acyl-CoA synthetase (AMP-forming)/AMP-acid ligase II